MSAEDDFETMQKVSGPIGAIGALAVRREYELARQCARDLSHEELAEVAVFLARMYAGGLLTAFENAGLPQEQAREMAAQQFQMQALAPNIMRPPGDGPPAETSE